jgi:hypothetical protein
VHGQQRRCSRYNLVYDAGHWVGKHCVNAVREVVTDDDIDLIILSHSPRRFRSA